MLPPKANELMAHSYAHLYGIPSTGLRFSPCMGHRGRPDMAMWLFTEAILQDKPIKVFNHGKLQRDFTYIDDIAEGVIRVLDQPPAAAGEFDPAQPNPAISSAPHRVFNIGNHKPVQLETFITTLEQCLGKRQTSCIWRCRPVTYMRLMRRYQSSTGSSEISARYRFGALVSSVLCSGTRNITSWHELPNQVKVLIQKKNF